MSTQSSGGPPGKRGARVLELVGLLFLPALVLAYMGGFLQSVWNLDAAAAVYPRIVIGVLVPITIWAIVVEYLRWRRRSGETLVVTRAGALMKQTFVQWRRCGVAIVCFGLYIFVLPTIGFYVSTAAYLVVTMVLLGVRNIFALMALLVGGVGFSYLFFSLLLGLALPVGIFY